MVRPRWTTLGGSGVDHKVVGVGDFNGDGTSDILWRNDATGDVGYWEMNDGTQTLARSRRLALDHKVVGVGDFNGDGTSDILWRNSTTGHAGDWQMNNGSPTWVGIGTLASSWQIAGIGDFNGDHTSDILWRDSTTGGVGYWQMNNGQVGTWVGVGNGASPWQIAGIGDFNGDGTSDILWRNSTTGYVGDWQMNNGQPTWLGIGTSEVARGRSLALDELSRASDVNARVGDVVNAVAGADDDAVGDANAINDSRACTYKHQIADAAPAGNCRLDGSSTGGEIADAAFMVYHGRCMYRKPSPY